MESKEPIRQIKIGDCEVTILGTAHVSESSVNEVRRLSEELKPDTVCIELCETRMKSMKDPDVWKKQDIFKVFKERRMYLLLSSLILSSFQKKLGQGKIKPGDEMRAAMEEGEKLGAKVVPIDREVQTTLKRSWGNVGLFSKIYLSSALLTSLVVKEDVDQQKIEEMKTDDALKDIFSQLPSRFDEVKKVIIDERDIYLAENIRRNAKGSKRLLAVVGAGHLNGIMQYIEKENDIEPLDRLPVQTLYQRYNWVLIPLAILGLGIFTYLRSGADAGKDLILSWIIVKSSLAALGALIALAHPVSILLAAVTAPIGNFNPIIKPGWLAALSDSWFRKPLVEDFERISEDSEHFTGYWKNRVIRIFLVLLLPQVGSTIGTYVVTWKAIQALF